MHEASVRDWPVRSRQAQLKPYQAYDKNSTGSYYCANVKRIRERIPFLWDKERIEAHRRGELHGFRGCLFAEPMVERRMTIRLVAENDEADPPIVPAFAMLGSIAYATGRVRNAEECVERFSGLLGDDAADDLIGVVLNRLLRKGVSTVPLLKAILRGDDILLETLKLLGYIVYYCEKKRSETVPLLPDSQLDEWLVNIHEVPHQELSDIARACLESGIDFMRRELGREGLSLHENWLNMAAFCETAFRAQTKVLVPLLYVDEHQMLKLDPRLDDKNRTWEKEASIDPALLERWLGPIAWSEGGLPGIGTVHFELVEDVGCQLQMGNAHGSCHRLVEGEHNYSLLAYVTDINKRVLLCKAKDGQLIGRRTVGLSDEGLHTCPAYPQCHPVVGRIFEEGVRHLREEELGVQEATTKSNLRELGITTMTISGGWEQG